MKMPIFPARIPFDKPQTGFTLTETLIALAIVTILAGVTGSALIRSLQSESTGYTLLRGAQVLRTIYCEQQLGTAQKDILKMIPSEWLVTFESTERETIPGFSTDWTLCTLSPIDRPSLQMNISF